jgi:hypothetical protein
MNSLTNIARSKGDPRLLETGPSSLETSDRLARGLGWFSIALGLAEIFGARPMARALGMEGRENLLRAYGVREIGAGVLSLSLEKRAGIWARVAGDGLDIATLMSELHPRNRKRHNVGLALAMVLGVAALDLATAQGLSAPRRYADKGPRSYRQRSGFPKGIEASRGAARDFRPKQPGQTPRQVSGVGTMVGGGSEKAGSSAVRQI